LKFSFFRQEALESAISEKDAHLALLEFNDGHRYTVKQTDVINQLRADKARLIKRLHEEVSKKKKNNNTLMCIWSTRFLYQTTV